MPSTVSSDDTVVVSAVPPIGDAFSAQAGSPEPFDDPMPSALDPIDGASAAASNAVSDLASDRAPETVMDATGMMPSLASVATEGSQATVGMANFAAGAPGRPGTDNSLTDPFPEAPTEFATGAAAAAAAGAPRTRSFDAKPMASAGAAAGMVTPTDARSARGGRGQAAGGAPTEVGQPPQRRGPSAGSSRPARGQSADPADRLQDTEFKLADKRRKQKPKEPNRLVLGLALGLVVLVGIAVAYFLTQGDDEATDGVVADQTTDSVVTEAEPLSDAAPAEVEETPAQPEPQVDEPTLFFEAAQTGPLQQGETYSIDLVGEPPGSLLQVVVDDRLQGEPDPQLPDLILPAGRHSLFIQMTNGAEVTQSTPIEVYVLGEQPPKGYRANLSSVDIQTEGWVEAIRQFDEYRAAGHEGLQLSPLSPGYWNIFVGGLGEDSAAVTSYCESFGLEVPVDCFGAYYEPTAAPASPDTTVAESMEETETTDEAMTDASDTATSTTAAGG